MTSDGRCLLGALGGRPSQATVTAAQATEAVAKSTTAQGSASRLEEEIGDPDTSEDRTCEDAHDGNVTVNPPDGRCWRLEWIGRLPEPGLGLTFIPWPGEGWVLGLCALSGRTRLLSFHPPSASGAVEAGTLDCLPTGAFSAPLRLFTAGTFRVPSMVGQPHPLQFQDQQNHVSRAAKGPPGTPPAMPPSLTSHASWSSSHAPTPKSAGLRDDLCLIYVLSNGEVIIANGVTTLVGERMSPLPVRQHLPARILRALSAPGPP